MFIARNPRIRQVVTDVWRTLAILFLWDVAVTIFYYAFGFTAPSLPVTLFGTVVALFLGVRINSAYGRWWEARTLWGAMINASRSLAREAITFIPDDAPNGVDLKRTLVLRQIAYAHSLRCQLRGQDPAPDVLRLLNPIEADEGLSRRNPANGLLDGSAKRMAQALREGIIDTIQQTQFDRILHDIANAQGGMERIRNTPMPHGYRFFPELFTRVFCVLLPIGLVETLGFATPVGSTIAGLMLLAALRVADDLATPFANTVHDVPMTSHCRTIEIDLLQAIGDEAPEPLQPVGGVLW